ncbi:MAG: NAD(P)/FAD-dependent oxidoreductase [Methylocystis sp.]|nr:NAD(P)/FAD-dependent oxidoreductase [Methylocystis sp.]MCA3582190.1 NAD(P)/FAD-dependent oxidoreductase [Methylocystis sp.]MCA3587918.1 NAD(P)/FAD-dependent oxidoreductase [Methylocystis sp.]MCA3590251.1 NAD(P)/FAD-dependent oxidoreductase [Methylocystis sp.]
MQAVVIGAGVVGLAIARALALRGHEVIVLEEAGTIGSGISSRNSEVIHGGMYYPAGSAKARLCVAGRRLLYAYCQSHGVPFRKCGKLIVATNEAESAKIASIHRQGRDNGVEGLELMTAAQARAMEPALACTAALHSSETGIVDSHALMLALQGDIEAAGGAIAFETPLSRVEGLGNGWRIHFGGAEPGHIDAAILVNAAGLAAWDVARLTEGYPRERIPKRVFAKGNYFSCAGRPAFSRLIYPAPVDGGLGVHLTLDQAGRMKFGPDVEWLGDIEPAEIDYTVDSARGDAFYAAIRTYWPALPDGALTADYAGVRPKLSGPGEAAADFRIEAPADHGLPGLVQLFGIESPGLTSSLAIAEQIAGALV